MRKRISIIFLSFILLLCCMCGCKTTSTVSVAPYNSTLSTVSVDPETTTEEPTTAKIDPISINLVAVGDMLMHASASTPALQSDGSYNYDYLFSNVRNSIEEADIAIANQETIFGGNEKGNIGYPNFNVRTELGDALVNNGFDVILHATNHSMDQGTDGIKYAINYWKNNHPQETYLGIHDSAEDAANITVYESKGIKIAMLNYTYGLNGYSLPQDSTYMVDLMTEENKGKISNDIKKAREMADFVIVFPHWGIEYQLEESAEQQNWAQFFADNGVDLVIGTHPHVVEPVKWVTGSNGNKMLVYYSLGNFVSIQYYNFCMLGGMAKVTITKDENGTYISNYGMDFLVTHYNSPRSIVTTYFLDDYTDVLASSHAILSEPPEKYQQLNQYYPFTVNGLKELAKSICPDLAK